MEGGGVRTTTFDPKVRGRGGNIKMQAVRKIKTMWRNAATLLLINGHFKYRPAPRHDLGCVLDKRTLPIFLESTDHDKQSKDETDLLFVQRHGNSGFMVSFERREP